MCQNLVSAILKVDPNRGSDIHSEFVGDSFLVLLKVLDRQPWRVKSLLHKTGTAAGEAFPTDMQ